MLTIIVFLALQENLTNLPNWEYVGALTVALLGVYLFISGRIITSKEANERVTEWKMLAMEATKENARSTQELIEVSKEYNESLERVLGEVKEARLSLQEVRYELKGVREELSRK